MLFIATLVACNAIDDAKDAVDGATETTIVQGSILAVQDPQDDTIGPLLANSPFAPGTGATVFLADASDPSAMEDSPVEGASVDLEGAALDEREPGLYALTPDQGPDYVAGASWTLTIDRGDEGGVRTAMLTLPPAAEDALEGTGIGGSVAHDANTPLTVDLSGRGYASSIVAVIAPDGSLAYSNQPEDIMDLYEAMKSDDAGSFDIPGTAFAQTGLYAVGVAGLQHTTADDLDGLNTVISKARAGQMVFWPVDVK